jgi:putative NADH-flavin reductase
LDQAMKLVVLGANGRTGRLVVQAALERRMDVVAVVRSADKTPAIHHKRLTILIGDPCDPAFLTGAFKDQDAVISTLGGRRPTKSATAIYFRSADAIVKATQGASIKRVVVTSSALLFPTGRFLDKLLRLVVPNIVRSATRMEAILRASQVHWTVARCGFLNDDQTSAYRAELGSLPENGSAVSRAALAAFLLDSIEQPDAKRGIFGVSKPQA